MHMRHDVFDTTLFGTPDQVRVVRGLAEIRAGRPVLVSTDTETVLALRVDGIDSSPPGRGCAPRSPTARLV